MASSRSELRLGALYGRYRDWRAPPPPPASSPLHDTSTRSTLAALVVQFEACTREDFRVGFACASSCPPQNPRIEWNYEVAFGISGNTEVVWRQAATGPTKEVDLIRVFTGRVCASETFVPYWIVVDQTHGFLSCGVGSVVGHDVLATCHDTKVSHVTHTAFSSWDVGVSFRHMHLHAFYPGDPSPQVATFAPPRLIVRADPLGTSDILTSAQREQLEAEFAASKRRAERFGTPFVRPDPRKVLDPRDVRKLQRSGAIEPGFSTGLDLTSREEQTKRELRMQRFETPPFAMDYSGEAVRALEQGLTQTEWMEKQVEAEKVRKRAARFGGGRIDWTPSSAKVRRERCDLRASGDRVVVRDDALHLYALDDDFQHVRTRDILAYFQGYGPSYVEWINDSSCTIVFQDAYTAMRALVALGHEIPSTDVEMAEGDATQGPDDRNAGPPDDEKQDHDAAFDRSHWFLGESLRTQTQDGPQAWRVLLRQATNDDFPPEKVPTTTMYHSRQSLRPAGRRPRRSARREALDPYPARPRPVARATSSKRIRENADGSLSIVRARGQD